MSNIDQKVHQKFHHFLLNSFSNCFASKSPGSDKTQKVTTYIFSNLIQHNPLNAISMSLENCSQVLKKKKKKKKPQSGANLKN